METPWESLTSWIWHPDYDDSLNPGQVVLFRRQFRLDTLPTEFVIHVSADSRYRLFLNGKSISIGPAKGTPLHWYYETVDAAASLRVGSNVLAAQVLRYSPAHRGNTSIMRTRIPGFILFAKSQDSQFRLSTDENWVCTIDHSISFNHQNKMDSFLSINEDVHGPSRHFLWEQLEFDDSNWTPATKIGHDSPVDMIQLSTLPWNLQERSIPQMTDVPRRFSQILTLKVDGASVSAETRALWDKQLQHGEAVTIPANCEICVDLVAPEYSTGYLCFSFGNGSGSLVRHLSAESYEGVPREDVSAWDAKKGDRMDHERGYLNGVWDTYTVAGRPLEKYETFWFRAFRVVRIQITTEDGPLSLFDFSYRQTNYPLEVLAVLSCPSSPVFDKFWDVSLRTLRNCMHETYEDCPYYEQSQFAFDTRTQILLTYVVSGDDRLARKALHDFHTSQRPDGLIAMRYPAHTNVELPGFSLIYPLMVHDHILYKGDPALAKMYSPTIDSILNHFDRLLDHRGLVGSLKATSWAFVDWVPTWDFGMPLALKEGPGTYFSLIYALALQHAARVADFIGRSELAQEYETRAQNVLAAVNKHCYKTPFYYDGPISHLKEPRSSWISQHCQVYAILTGAVQGPEAQALLRRTVQDGSMARMSTSQLFYLFRALEKAGTYELSQTQWRPWEKFLEQNLDTWPEELEVPRSDCHAWSAIPLYEIPCMILGVQPAGPGFSKALVQPRFDLVDEIDGSVVTPNGLIRVAWKKTPENSKYKLVVEGPVGISIQIVAQGGNKIIDSFQGNYEAHLELEGKE